MNRKQWAALQRQIEDEKAAKSPAYKKQLDFDRWFSGGEETAYPSDGDEDEDEDEDE